MVTILGIFSNALFTVNYLRLKELSKGLHRAYWMILTLCGLDLLRIPVIGIGRAFMGAGLLVFLLFPLNIAASIVAIMKDYGPAKIFIASWIAVLLGVLLNFLKNFGIVRASGLTVYGMPLGSIVQIVLLSIGLAQYVEFIRRTFGRYVTDQVVQQILDAPDGLRLGGQRRFVTIMMTDLRGFTNMFGSMEPEAVVKLLNNYLATMTRIIMRHGGTIDEFIGDAILVVFGAPILRGNDELRAVACAIEMLNAMAEVNEWNRQHGLPPVEMGIGIHSGEAVLGNIGSESRAKYGIVGATINLASRVESSTVGGQVLISAATRERCGSALTLGGSQTLKPKGVKGTLTVHEVFGVGAPYHIQLKVAEERFVSPSTPLRFRYAVVKDKQVGELTDDAHVVRVSPSGAELQLGKALDVFINLQLRVLDEEGALREGDLYGKILRAGSTPGLAFVRWTSMPPELRPVFDSALSGAESNDTSAPK